VHNQDSHFSQQVDIHFRLHNALPYKKTDYETISQISSSHTHPNQMLRMLLVRMFLGRYTQLFRDRKHSLWFFSKRRNCLLFVKN